MAKTNDSPTPWVPATARLRIVAWFTDFFLVWLIPAAVGGIADRFFQHSGSKVVWTGLVIAILFSVIFSVLMETVGVAKWGATLGKGGVGMKVSRSAADFIKITGSQVFVRFVAKAALPVLLVAYAFPPLIFLWAVWPLIIFSFVINSKTRQGLDDRIAKTYVVMKNPALEQKSEVDTVS